MNPENTQETIVPTEEVIITPEVTSEVTASEDVQTVNPDTASTSEAPQEFKEEDLIG